MENYFGYTMEFAITYCRDVENWFEKTLINYYINIRKDGEGKLNTSVFKFLK